MTSGSGPPEESAHKRVHIFNRTGEVFQHDHAATRSVSVGSSLGARELFTRRDTVHVCSDL